MCKLKVTLDFLNQKMKQPQKHWDSHVEASSSLSSYLSYLSCCILLSVLLHFHRQSVSTSLKMEQKKQKWIIAFQDKDWTVRFVTAILYCRRFITVQRHFSHTQLMLPWWQQQQGCSSLTYLRASNLWPQGNGRKLTHQKGREIQTACCRSSLTKAPTPSLGSRRLHRLPSVSGVN